MGWASLDSGRLLRRASTEFDAFVTVDRGVAFQQNLAGLTIAVIVIHVKRNTLATLKPLVPELLEALERAQGGSVTRLNAAAK
jgi:hypothetical protein